MTPPRLRIFAGPNGSGKSTLNAIINKDLLGIYINADDLEKNINTIGYLDFSPYPFKTMEDVLFNFLQCHPLIAKANLLEEIKKLTFKDNRLYFTNVALNSYFTSVCADYIRHRLLDNRISFTFETVMSSADKVYFMNKAKNAGYRVYLYYIATEDPIINISRVQNRVQKGGHFVPEDKIKNRYYRSLELLREAVSYSNRAYIFDNSQSKKVWLAEITDAKNIDLKSEYSSLRFLDLTHYLIIF